MPNDINKLHAYIAYVKMQFNQTNDFFFPFFDKSHLFCFIYLFIIIWIDFILAIWYGLWSNWIISLRCGIFIIKFPYFSIFLFQWFGWQCVSVFRNRMMYFFRRSSIEFVVFEKFRFFLLCFCHLNSNVCSAHCSMHMIWESQKYILVPFRCIHTFHIFSIFRVPKPGLWLWTVWFSK